MCHHSRHVHAVPVQVFQEDICIPPSKRASLRNNAEQRVHVTHTDMHLQCIWMTSRGSNIGLNLKHSSGQSVSGEYIG